MTSQKYFSPAKRMKLDESSSSSSPTRKFSGAATFKTRFNPTWTKKWPFIVAVAENDYEFKCTICSKISSCSHQGEKDVSRHIEGVKHKLNQRSATSTMRLASCGFRPENDSIGNQVIRAETKISLLLAESNIQMAFADKLSEIFKDLFPDSKIAKEYSSKRTKSSCILNEALAPHFLNKTIEMMKTDPFSLATDGSNDTDIEKMNPLTVRLYDTETKCVVTRFLDMCCTSGVDSGKASSIFEKIDEKISQFNIPWTNCVGFSMDNASVNMGAHNSILSRVMNKNSSVFFMGCPCHIIHNVAQKGAAEFASVTGFDVEDFCIDIFYFFDKSNKRKGALRDYNEFCDEEYRKILKHINVRWLSLEKAVERILRQFKGLRSYFLSENESCVRFRRLKKRFESPMTELYLLFFKSVMPAFTETNLFLQREDPCIYLVDKQLKKFMKQLMGKFVSIDAMKSASDLSNVDLTKNKEKEKIYFGTETKIKLYELYEEGDISNTEKEKFHDGILSFYFTATSYGLKKLPLKCEVLQKSAFVNFSIRETCEFSDLEYFIIRFGLNFSYEEMDKLQNEFVEYQLLEDGDIPQSVWDHACVTKKEDGVVIKYHRMDIIWSHLSAMKGADGQLRFFRLFKVARIVLVLPHSNAQEERVFSMVRKNKTPFRSNLNMEGTLSSILTVKLAGVDAVRYRPNNDLLKKAKSATWEYNKRHSKN